MKIYTLLGKGSYGKVFKFKHNNEEYAVKQTNGVLDDELIRSFLLEIIIMKSACHPNIIKCSHSFFRKHDILICMDIYPTNLQELLRKNEIKNIKIQTHIINKILVDILSGLEYLHNNNILHLDISDDNILIKKDYTCVITDFGLSSLTSDKIHQIYNKDSIKKKKLCQKYPVFKNPFAPPEVLNKDFYDSSADIWAFGILMIKLFNNIYIYENTEKRNNQLVYIQNYLLKNDIEKKSFMLKNIDRKLDKDNIYLSLYDITYTHLEILMSIFQQNIKKRPSATKLIKVLNFYEIIINKQEDKDKNLMLLENTDKCDKSYEKTVILSENTNICTKLMEYNDKYITLSKDNDKYINLSEDTLVEIYSIENDNIDNIIKKYKNYN